MRSTLATALKLFLVLSLVTGIAYPLLVTALAQAAFPNQANGSLIRRDGAAVGSSLIGQSFRDPKYFWGRPSATSPAPYTAFDAASLAGSAGSNLGPTNPALFAAVRERAQALRAADPMHRESIPIDLVTASGSGLDPHLSPAAAEYQVARVAQSRGIPEAIIRELVAAETEPPTWGILGEPRVHVLRLNIALDALAPR
jgi:K+-transporting ATPase ATPase C chain